jgi:hypothetical protein
MIDAVCLFQDGATPALAAQHPPGAGLPDLPVLAALSIPDVVRSGAHAHSVFCYNTASLYCFSWAFHFRASSAAIVIATPHFYPTLFFEFLRSVAKSFSCDSEANDAQCRFLTVSSLLQSWARTGPSEWHIYYPFESFMLDVSQPESCCSGFSIAPIVADIELVWTCLLSGDGVLIVAPTPDVASTTALACISLLGPVAYKDPCLLYTEGADPRAGSLRRYRLIATTDAALADLPFGVIVNVTGVSFPPSFDAWHRYRTLSLRHFSAMLSMMDFYLLGNPYYDILELPLNYRTFKVADAIVKKLLDDIQKTDTFRVWRRDQIVRQHTRTAFLSITPKRAVAKLAPKDCPRALKWLEILAQRYARDHHLQSVIAAHQALIRKMLRRKRPPESAPPPPPESAPPESAPPPPPESAPSPPPPEPEAK